MSKSNPTPPTRKPLPDGEEKDNGWAGWRRWSGELRLGPGEGPRLHLRFGIWEQRGPRLPSWGGNKGKRKERTVQRDKVMALNSPVVSSPAPSGCGSSRWVPGVTVAQKKWRDTPPHPASPPRLEGSCRQDHSAPPW